MQYGTMISRYFLCDIFTILTESNVNIGVWTFAKAKVKPISLMFMKLRKNVMFGNLN